MIVSVFIVQAINISVPSAPGTGYYLQSTSTGAYTYRKSTSSLPVFGADGNIVAYMGSTSLCSGTDQVTSASISPTGTISVLCSSQGAGNSGSVSTSSPGLTGGQWVVASTYNTIHSTTSIPVTSTTVPFSINGTGLLVLDGSYFIPLTASGTVWNNKLSTSTDLSPLNFSTTSISQWNNNSNFITLLSLSGVGPISYNNLTGAISFVNPGYIMSAPATTTITAGGTATGPVLTFATSGISLVAINCTGSTCTFAQSSSSLNLGTAAGQTIAFFLQTANNLSDLTSTSSARSNIGLNNTNQDCGSDFVKIISATGTVTCATPTGGGTLTGNSTSGYVGVYTGAQTLTGYQGLTFDNTASSGLDIYGIASSTELRSPSGTIGTLFDFQGNKYVTSTTAGSGTVTTSSKTFANYFANWNSTDGSGLNGSTTLFSSGLNLFTGGNFNATGTITQSGVPVVTSGTLWANVVASSGLAHSAVTVLDGTTIDFTLSGQQITAEGLYTAGDALTLTGVDFDFDGGASPGGSLGGTWASPTIDDLFLLNTGDIGSGNYEFTGLVSSTEAITASSTIQKLSFTNATGTGNLQVATLRSTGAANISSTLNVTGAVGLASTLGVTGQTTLASATSTNLEASGTFKVTGQSIHSTSTSIGTSTFPAGIMLNVVSNGSTTVKFGDASSTKPACFMAADYPGGTSWTYFWFNAGAIVASTTSCN